MWCAFVFVVVCYVLCCDLCDNKYGVVFVVVGVLYDDIQILVCYIFCVLCFYVFDDVVFCCLLTCLFGLFCVVYVEW